MLTPKRICLNKAKVESSRLIRTHPGMMQSAATLPNVSMMEEEEEGIFPEQEEGEEKDPESEEEGL